MADRTPRERRQDRTRKDILRAARELVLERGRDGLSLREVARRADYSPAGLYEYFDGLDDLVATLAGEASARLRDRLASVPRDLPPAERLAAVGAAYVAFARRHPQEFLLLFTRLPSKRKAHAEPVPGDSPFAVVRDAVREALPDARGDRREDEIAYAIWALAHGQAMLQLTHLRGFEADFDAADGRALRALVSGLAAST